MADGGNQTHLEGQNSQSNDPWREREEQLEKLVQVKAYRRRRRHSPGHLVGVDEGQVVRRQAEGESGDEGIKVRQRTHFTKKQGAGSMLWALEV